MNQRAIALAESLRADPHPTPDYRVCRTAQNVCDYLVGFHDAPLACDTESLPDGSCYCVTFSHTPGTGRLIYIADDGQTMSPLSIFRQWLANCRHIIFHNYLHDCVPFAAHNLPIARFADTMVRAYHLCLGGGGDEEDSESKAGRGSLSLKVLAYRHLNMRMTSFKDTVYPHSIPQLALWLTDAATAIAPPPKIKKCLCGCPQSSHEPRGKTQRHTGMCSTCICTKYQAAPTLIPSITDKYYAGLYTKTNRLANRLLNETDTNWADSKKDPWKFIQNNWEDDISTLELLSGPIPAPSIAFVPEPELLHYACRDADATIRLHLHMRHLKPWLFWP